MMLPGSPEAERIARIREAVRSAILVLDALGYREWRSIAGSSEMADLAIDDPKTGYGYREVTYRLMPSAKEIGEAEEINGWLTWLCRSEGPAALKRLRLWARGTPIWLIAERENCSERTIKNRVDRSIAAMLGQFGEPVEVEAVEEGAVPEHALSFADEIPSHHSEGSEVRPSKTYIAGMGFMKGSRKMRRGRNLINERKLNANRPR